MAISPAGSGLTLTVIEDSCAARAAVFGGDWTHTACREDGSDCLGPIEAGTYTSGRFDPFATGAQGQLEYTVPDGWANAADHTSNYVLRPADDYQADPAADGNDTFSGIYVDGGILAADQPADCAAVPATGVAVTAAAIADHIASLPGLDVVDNGVVSLDGRPARSLDLAVDSSFATPCPWSNGNPFQSLIMWEDLGAEGGVWGLDAGARHRVLFLDVAPGRVVGIFVEAPSDRFDQLLLDATPIVESMHFGQ